RSLRSYSCLLLSNSSSRLAELFFFYSYRDNRDLHSFPTRRSSDLDMFEHNFAGFGFGQGQRVRSRPFRPTQHVAIMEPDYSLPRSEEHTSELQSRENLVCRLLLEKKKKR